MVVASQWIGDHGIEPAATIPPVKTPAQRADEMDAMHEKGIKAFPAKTAGKGNQVLQPRMDGNVKVYDLTTAVTDWEVEPGKIVMFGMVTALVVT